MTDAEICARVAAKLPVEDFANEDELQAYLLTQPQAERPQALKTACQVTLGEAAKYVQARCMEGKQQAVAKTVTVTEFGWGSDDDTHLSTPIKIAFYNDKQLTDYLGRIGAGCLVDPEGGTAMTHAALTEDVAYTVGTNSVQNALDNLRGATKNASRSDERALTGSVEGDMADEAGVDPNAIIEEKRKLFKKGAEQSRRPLAEFDGLAIGPSPKGEEGEDLAFVEHKQTARDGDVKDLQDRTKLIVEHPDFKWLAHDRKVVMHLGANLWPTGVEELLEP